jgi:alkanesulfonate monooxygenase SsuD/methylene tetrahydromethanopterin reductase-like flavin-dependent oxidoreductase (luciferase family)
VYLPQVGFALGRPRGTRRRACDRAGIDAVWLMDHLYPPGMPNVAGIRGMDDGNCARDDDRADPHRASRPRERVFATRRSSRKDGDSRSIT